jgi:hypothetical protein
VGRAGRGQGDPLDVGGGAGDRLEAELGRRAAVEGDGLQIRQRGDQADKVVGPLLADGGVEAAGAVGVGDDVPQGDVMGLQGLQPRLIVQRDQVDADDLAEQPPEAVLGMAVVAAAGDGGVAGQAAENQQTGVEGEDRREAGLSGRGLAVRGLAQP